MRCLRPVAVLTILLLIGAASVPMAAGRASESAFGKLIVVVQTLSNKPVDRVVVRIRVADGKVDSSSTPRNGTVTFAKVRAGDVIVEAHDRIWIQRAKGAYLPWGTDTVKITAGKTIRHILRMSQRDPPSLYR